MDTISRTLCTSAVKIFNNCNDFLCTILFSFAILHMYNAGHVCRIFVLLQFRFKILSLPYSCIVYGFLFRLIYSSLLLCQTGDQVHISTSEKTK